ncbi:MAG: beta-galactosidase trimerization domain-containing protein [Chloroflexi bacterium]|nr:beta-galactosidase trimerization domain-containing protein [Chloroflexota bacterium]
MSEIVNWWRRPLRAVHTVLREPDAAGYDLEGVLHWLREWRANVYAVNGGGLCAFYQTEVPFHRKNRFLDGRDLFKEIVDACHEAGIKVVARMDFRGGHREVFEAHPDWFARDAEGGPKMNVSLFAACPNSPFRNEGYAFPVVHEVFEHCRPDGIWENAAAFGGRCYCPTCRWRFREETDFEVPLAENWDDPVWRRYVRWRYDSVREHTRKLRDVVKSHGADKSYCGEFFTYLEARARENAEDVDEIAALWDYQMACIFPLTRDSYHSPLLPVPLWRAEEQIKYLRATAASAEQHDASGSAEGLHSAAAAGSAEPAQSGRTPQTLQTPVMLYGHFDNQSRYTTPAGEELRLWLTGMAAQGGSPWDCSFVGVPPSRWWDRRHVDTVQRFYGFMAEHEEAFWGLESVAEVALVHSQRTQDRFASSDPARDGYITHVRGWELALFAAHAQWDVLPPSQVRPEILRRYRAVILPNVACMSDEEAATYRRYVGEGGALLATFETGCFAADGAMRGAGLGGALDDVLGVRDLGLGRRGPLPYAYTRIRWRDTLTAGFDETEAITNEGYVRQVAPRDGAQVHATLVPEIFPQPPDLSYPSLWENDAPVLVTNRYGGGRVVYFANQTDRLNVTSGHPDHQRLLENALRWALDGKPPLVETDAPADVHVTLLRQPHRGALYVHLVNYSGAHGRPVCPPHRAGAIELKLNVPGMATAPRTADLLMSGASVPISADGEGGGQLRLSIPQHRSARDCAYRAVALLCHPERSHVILDAVKDLEALRCAQGDKELPPCGTRGAKQDRERLLVL